MKLDGILLVDKPAGVSSFEVIEGIREVSGIRKVGHSGVLDKGATGLLVCGLGKATKLLRIFESSYKVYEAEIVFGLLTDTLDVSGKILEKRDFDSNRLDYLEDVLKEFEGDIDQEVPVYSNVKVHGRRLHRYAYANTKPVLLPRRKVFIYGIELISKGESSAVIRVVCSKGTYIRTLSRDIALRLGTVGVLRRLRRTYVHPFDVSNAVVFESLDAKSLENNIIPVEKAVDFLPKISLASMPDSSHNFLFSRPDGYYRLYIKGRFAGVFYISKPSTVRHIIV